jgi:cardiolipin synthase A/B
MPSTPRTAWTWLRNGEEAFRAMLAAIEAARKSVCLETYIFSASLLGDRFRDALVRAQQRGARVRVLLDAVGSYGLAGDYWAPLMTAGGKARVFNPLALRRFWIRSHRKLLVCDDAVAIVGGFNIAPEYNGDGVARGWLDFGLRVAGTLVGDLAASFDEMFARADFLHKRFVRLRRPALRRTVTAQDGQLLLGGPGRGRSPIRQALLHDLARARSVQIIVAYFLPTGRLRRMLARVARRGGRVQLILAGKSDLTLSQLAGQSLYRRLLNAGVEIYEYQPQVLHAKLVVVDGAVFVGSANLDPRSMSINYELVLRFQNLQMAAQARTIFADVLPRCRRIELAEWQRSRTFWRRLKQRWAYFLVARIDPYLARWQWRALPD